MSVSVKMTSKDKADFNRDLKKFQKGLGITQTKALNIVAQDIRSTAVKLVNRYSTDTGLLKNSIKIEKPEKDRRIIGTNTGYGLYVEFGRRAGSKPPSYKDLIDWVRRKKIAGTYSIKTRRRAGNKKTQEKQNIGVAIAIAKNIGKNGIKAKPFLRPAFESGKRKLTRELKKQFKRNA